MIIKIINSDSENSATNADRIEIITEKRKFSIQIDTYGPTEGMLTIREYITSRKGSKKPSQVITNPYLTAIILKP